MSISEPLVYIVILNWKDPDITLRCVQSLKRSKYKKYKVVLINNSPSEEIRKLIEEENIDIAYIGNKTNLGFTGGANQGIDYAMKHDANYIWLLNNDVEVPEDCLLNLITEMESDERIGLLSPVIVDPAKPLNPFYGKKVDSVNGQMLNAFDEQTYLEWLTSEPWKIELWGTALLINKNLVNAIGDLDNNFFAYYEDNDYSFRSNQAGFQNRTCLRANVFHKTDNNIYTEKKSYRFFLIARNHYLFWIKRGISKPTAIYWTLNVFIPKIVQLHREDKDIVAQPYLGGLWQGIIKNTFGLLPANLNAPKLVYKFTVFIAGILLDLLSKFRCFKGRINIIFRKI
jgi:Predicted glycosyltransferases